MPTSTLQCVFAPSIPGGGKCSSSRRCRGVVARRRSSCASSLTNVVNRDDKSRQVIAFAAEGEEEGAVAEETPTPTTFRVLITGSTKGLGLALAQRFLEAGKAVYSRKTRIRST